MPPGRSLGSAYVTIYADDKDAEAKFDTLRGKMDALAQDIQRKRSLNIQDTAAKAALDAVSVKAARLADKLAHQDLDIRGQAKAEAQLSALQLQADRLNSKLNDLSVSSRLSSQLKKISDSDFFKPSVGGSIFALLPTLIPAAAGAAGAIGLVAASFGAASVSAGLFGIAAKSVLTSASQDAKKVQDLQTKLATATTAAGKKVIQDQITALTQGWTPAYRTIIGDMEDLPNQWKAVSIKITASALVPWLDVVKQAMGDLVPLIKPVADEFEAWGKSVDKYFKSKTGSAEIKSMATALGQFASLQLADLVQFIRDFATGVHNLAGDLSGSGVYFGSFGDHLAQWGNAFAKWSSSKQARDDVNNFVKYLKTNGATIVTTVTSLAKLLPGMLSGASAIGNAELKALNVFLAWVAGLPPAWSKGLTEAAGALLIMSKLGVLKVGLSIVGVGKKVIDWLTGGSTAAIGAAGMQTAGDTMVTAAAAMQAAADTMVGADAAGGAGGAAGSAAGSAGKGAGGGLISRLLPSGAVAAAGYVGGGVLIGGVIKGAGDALAPKGTQAGKLNNVIQGAFAGIPGINIFSGFIAKSAPALGNFLTQSGKKTADTFGAMGAVSSRYAGPAVSAAKTVHDQTADQQDKMQAKTSQTFGAMGAVASRLTGPLTQPFKTANQVGSDQFSKLQGNVKNATGKMQASIDSLHGKTVNVGVNETGKGVFTIAQVSSLSQPGGKLAGPMAMGGAVTGGTAGKDSVLAALMPGEVVVPKGMVAAGAVDHLRGHLPGFAGGGYVGSPSGLLGPFTSAQESSFQANVTDVMKARMTAALHKAIKAASTTSAAGGLGRAGLRQIENWWIGAGGPGGGVAHIAAAITGAESGFNPRAVQAGQPYATTGWGLWQITPGNSEPQAGINAQLLNGPSNAIAAVAKYHGAGGNFSPWTTYESGAYLHFMAKGGLVKQIGQALGVVRNHPGLPQKYNSLEIQLESWAGRVAQDKQLRKAGAHNTGLDADQRHVRALRHAIAPLAADRKTVRNVRGHLRTDEASLRREISAADARGMGGLAGKLTRRLNRDLDVGGQMGAWLDRLGPAYTSKAKRHDSNFIDSVITGDLKRLGLPIGTFDKGGYLPTGLSLAYNGLGRPERVGNGPLQVVVRHENSNAAFDRFMTEWMQRAVQVKGGGDVQVAFGRVN